MNPQQNKNEENYTQIHLNQSTSSDKEETLKAVREKRHITRRGKFKNDSRPLVRTGVPGCKWRNTFKELKEKELSTYKTTSSKNIFQKRRQNAFSDI